MADALDKKIKRRKIAQAIAVQVVLDGRAKKLFQDNKRDLAYTKELARRIFDAKTRVYQGAVSEDVKEFLGADVDIELGDGDALKLLATQSLDGATSMARTWNGMLASRIVRMVARRELSILLQGGPGSLESALNSSAQAQATSAASYESASASSAAHVSFAGNMKKGKFNVLPQEAATDDICAKKIADNPHDKDPGAPFHPGCPHTTKIAEDADVDDEVSSELSDEGVAGRKEITELRRSPLRAGESPSEVRERIARRAGVSEDTVRGVQWDWASTSADERPEMLAFQKAVQEEFRLPVRSIAHLKQRKRWSEAEKVFAGKGDELRKIARSMYEETQVWLQSRGITKVRLFRGMRVPKTSPLAEGLGVEAKAVNAQMQAASSWSVIRPKAAEFAQTLKTDPNVGIVLTADIPSSRILSLERTGLGATGEGEVITLSSAGKVLARIQPK